MMMKLNIMNIIFPAIYTSLALSAFVFKNVLKSCLIFNYILRYILFRLRSIKHSGRTEKKHIIFSYEKIGIIFIALFLSISNITYSLSYDSAMYAAQKGDMQSADEKMRTVVVNAPDRADVLYDAGVLAYELKNFSQAIAYFTRAADQARADKDMQVRSYFNAGNSSVAVNDLHKALEFYDKVLEITPDDEYARHNRGRVAQMLEQQENKQNQQNENKKDQQNDAQKQDQNQSEQGGDQQNDGENDQQKDDSSQDKSPSQDESQKESQKADQGKGAEQGDARKDGKQQGYEAQNQDSHTDDQKRDGNEDLDKQSRKTDNKGKHQEDKKHERSPGKKSKSGDKNSIASQGGQEQGGENKVHGNASDKADVSDEALAKSDKPVDAWLSAILDEQELHDKAMNKKLMEMRIREHGGKNVQNNW